MPVYSNFTKIYITCTCYITGHTYLPYCNQQVSGDPLVPSDQVLSENYPVQDEAA